MLWRRSIGAPIVALRFLDASDAYDKALDRNDDSNDFVDAARAATYDARRTLFSAEPTAVAGVAALLPALAKKDTEGSPIEIAINCDCADKVNDCLRRLAKVLEAELA
jgi:hypothetical protein